jgi:hypothetical protein
MWTFGLVMLIGCAAFLPSEAIRIALGTTATTVTPVAAGGEEEPASLPIRTVPSLDPLERVS